jgi:hypothetical protein
MAQWPSKCENVKAKMAFNNESCGVWLKCQYHGNISAKSIISMKVMSISRNNGLQCANILISNGENNVSAAAYQNRRRRKRHVAVNGVSALNVSG